MSEDPKADEKQDDGGQVSEVAAMPEGDDATISDGQSVAGNPDSPEPEDVGEIGPASNTFRNRPQADRDRRKD